MFFVYIIKSRKDKLCYIGSTGDLRRRVMEHNNGLVKSTVVRKPFDIVYYEAYRSKKDAYLREARLKKFKRAYNQLKKRISESLET